MWPYGFPCSWWRCACCLRCCQRPRVRVVLRAAHQHRGGGGIGVGTTGVPLLPSMSSPPSQLTCAGAMGWHCWCCAPLQQPRPPFHDFTLPSSLTLTATPTLFSTRTYHTRALRTCTSCCCAAALEVDMPSPSLPLEWAGPAAQTSRQGSRLQSLLVRFPLLAEFLTATHAQVCVCMCVCRHHATTCSHDSERASVLALQRIARPRGMPIS